MNTILETVMMATGMRFAAVARVTADRWIACRTADEMGFGLADGDEAEIQSTFCQLVRKTSEKVLFVFDPFQRGTGTSPDGPGLGLYIASSIAAAHNGRIDVESDGDLTAFTIRLPLPG